MAEETQQRVIHDNKDRKKDLDDILRRGGKGQIDLLAYCVFSKQLEPLFVFLAREYRLAPTASRALALHDMFCAPAAPARLQSTEVLEPRDLRLVRSIEALRRSLTPEPPVEGTSAEGEVPAPPPPVAIPPGHLFDTIVAHILAAADGPWASIAVSYDPTREPYANLPGGRMNASQRFFVENVWRPHVRPRLVAAGFWRVSTVGG